MNKIIDIILNEVASIQNTVQVAKEQKISYKAAKIMDKYSIPKADAIKIAEIIKDCRVSDYVAKEFFEKNYSDRKIIEYITNDFNSAYPNKIIEQLGLQEDYAIHLYEFKYYHIPCEVTLIIDRLIINIIKNIKNVDKEKAIYMYYNQHPNRSYAYHKLVLERENAVKEYSIRCNIEDADKSLQYKSFLKHSNYHQEYRGITIVSKSEDGIETIKKIIDISLRNADPNYKDTLLYFAQNKNLFVSDINPECDLDKNRSFFTCELNYIYLNHTCIENAKDNIRRSIKIFYHETTHFIDYAKGKDENGISIVNPEFIKIYNKIANTLDISNLNTLPKFMQVVIGFANNYESLERGITIHKYLNYSAEVYANDDELKTKWQNEILSRKPFISKKDFELLLEQKKHYEKMKFILLSSSILDIYDSILNGALHDVFKTSGHGRTYYKIPNKKLKEFVADIGAMYNIDRGKDLIKYEFGDEIGEEIVSLFEKLYTYENHPNKPPFINIEDLPIAR